MSKMTTAEVVDAYGYLILEMTQGRRNEVCSQIKSSLVVGVVSDVG